MNFEIIMPQWAAEHCANLPRCIEDPEERMRTVIEFSRINFERDTGGPFAAGVFERDSGRVVSIGVNLVVSSNCSSAHAEIVALSLAQKNLGTFDLGGEGMPHHQLVVNGRPCAMCFGAIPWSGVRSVISAASGAEIEKLTGFDEGPIHLDWITELENRGIEVVEGLLADEACDVFCDFAKADRKVYNGRSG